MYLYRKERKKKTESKKRLAITDRTAEGKHRCAVWNMLNVFQWPSGSLLDYPSGISRFASHYQTNFDFQMIVSTRFTVSQKHISPFIRE